MALIFPFHCYKQMDNRGTSSSGTEGAASLYYKGITGQLSDAFCMLDAFTVPRPLHSVTKWLSGR